MGDARFMSPEKPEPIEIGDECMAAWLTLKVAFDKGNSGPLWRVDRSGEPEWFGNLLVAALRAHDLKFKIGNYPNFAMAWMDGPHQVVVRIVRDSHQVDYRSAPSPGIPDTMSRIWRSLAEAGGKGGA